MGPKRASKIRKLYEIEKAEGGKTSNTTALLKKHVIRRTFKSAKNPDAHERQKAPKIQRLITDVRLRRKRIVKDRKVKRWRKTLAATEAYHKLYEEWSSKKKAAHHQAKIAERKASKAPQEEPKKEAKKAPVEKQKRVEINKGGADTGVKVMASITKVKKVVKKKE